MGTLTAAGQAAIYAGAFACVTGLGVAAMNNHYNTQRDLRQVKCVVKEIHVLNPATKFQQSSVLRHLFQISQKGFKEKTLQITCQKPLLFPILREQATQGLYGTRCRFH